MFRSRHIIFAFVIFWGSVSFAAEAVYEGPPINSVCQLILAQLKELSYGIQKIPANLWRILSRDKNKDMYRGLKTPPVRLSPRHQSLFERVDSKSSSVGWFDSSDVTQDSAHNYPKIFVEWESTKKLSDYMNRLKDCENCKAGERDFFMFLLNRLSDSMRGHLVAVLLDIGWYSTQNSDLKKHWEPQMTSFNQALDMLLDGAQQNTPPKELIDRMKAQIQIP